MTVSGTSTDVSKAFSAITSAANRRNFAEGSNLRGGDAA
jgi:hypothetical protein